MAMPARSRHWTLSEVRALIRDNPRETPRYELVDGELLVTPGAGFVHQRLVVKLIAALHLYLSRYPIGVVMTSPSDVELEEESLVQPDVYVLPMDEAGRLRGAPADPAAQLLLAVEVLSPSTARYDRVAKRALYQRRAPEYWIVDNDARIIERWTPASDRPEIVTTSLAWAPEAAAAPFELDVVALIAEL
jgi:Uma2 family endonuclease